MSQNKLSRLFRSVSIREAGRLHEQLLAGSTSQETRNLLRQALLRSGLASK